VRFAALALRIRRAKFREPDLFAVASDDRSAPPKPLLARRRPGLEVVSEDKPERDLVDKRGDYAEAGVPDNGSSTR